MAALRYVARKLGRRAFQHTQTAVIVQEQRLVVRRLIQTEVSPKYPCGKSAAGPGEALRQIQEKKEEIYDLIDVVQKKYGGNVGRANRMLQQQLSASVKPRPNDSHWRFLRGGKMTNDSLPATFALMTPFLIMGIWLDRKEKKQNKQEQ